MMKKHPGKIPLQMKNLKTVKRSNKGDCTYIDMLYTCYFTFYQLLYQIQKIIKINQLEKKHSISSVVLKN